MLGLDPAFRGGVGYGLVDLGTGEVYDLGYAHYDEENEFERQVERAIETIPHADQVVALVVERIAGGRGVQSLLKVSDAAGVTAGVAARTWPEATLWRPSPAEWKRAAGLPGNARKDDVAERAFELAPWIHPAIPRQDTLDAILMAYAESAEIRRVVGEA